jgi:aspartate aminotransferase-like enzyme
VSALRLPPGTASPAVVAALAARGWLAAPGLDTRADALLRIGHMGDLEPSHLQAFLEALDGVV